MTEPFTPLLRITEDCHADAIVIDIEGDVDLATVSELQAALSRGLTAASASCPLIVDLCKVTFFGSTGLAELIAAHGQAEVHGVSLRIVSNNPTVLRPITTTGLATILDIYPEYDAAVRHS